MARKGSRALKWLLGLALSGGALGMLSRLSPGDPRLLDRATFVANTGQWHPAQNPGSIPVGPDIGIHWLSDDAILIGKYEGGPSTSCVFYKYDFRTRREERQDNLTKAYQALQGVSVTSPEVSPNGSWVLCTGRSNQYILAEMNGPRHHTYSTPFSNSYHRLYWMSDGHHWLENNANTSNPHVVLHDADHPEADASLPLKSEREQTRFGELAAVVSPQEGIVLEDPYPMGDAIIIQPPHPGRPHPITLSRISLDAHATVQAQYHIEPPQGSAIYRTFFSPQRGRIAWVVVTDRGNAFQNWLSDHLSFIHRNERIVQEVWVSQVDGSRMHAIGSVEIQLRDIFASLSLQWLPDGKHLSFEYHDRLYTVPVD